MKKYIITLLLAFVACATAFGQEVYKPLEWWFENINVRVYKENGINNYKDAVGFLSSEIAQEIVQYGDNLILEEKGRVLQCYRRTVYNAYRTNYNAYTEIVELFGAAIAEVRNQNDFDGKKRNIEQYENIVAYYTEKVKRIDDEREIKRKQEEKQANDEFKAKEEALFGLGEN